MKEKDLEFQEEEEIQEPEIQEPEEELMEEPEEIEEEVPTEEEEEEALKMALDTDDFELAKSLISEVLKARKKRTFTCECLDCGYVFTSKEHCSSTTCPKCGSNNVRRAERPGPGQPVAKEEKIDKSAYTECMRRQLKAGVSFKEAAKICSGKKKGKKPKYPYAYPYPTSKEIEKAIDILEKARRRLSYPYPYYPYPYSYAYPYPYPYPKRIRRKSEILEAEDVEKKRKKPQYPYPGLKKRLPELFALLEKLLNRTKNEAVKKNLKIIKALVTHVAETQFGSMEKILGLSDDPYTGIYEFRDANARLELSDNILKKEILKVGRWFHSDALGGLLDVTKESLKKLLENFKKGIIEHVYVPVGHTSDPMRNAGEVTDLELSSNGNSLIATMEIKDSEVLKRIKEGLIKCTSVSIDENYTRKDTGENVGPTLLHVALVSEPYIKGLSNFVSLSEETGKYIIPVEFEDQFEEIFLQEEPEAPETSEEPAGEEPQGESEGEEITEGESSEESAEEGEVGLSEAERVFDRFLREGKVVPSQKEAIIRLLTSKGTVDLGDGKKVDIKEAFIELLEKSPQIIPLEEKGIMGGEPERKEEVQFSPEEKERISFLVEKMKFSEKDAQEIILEERRGKEK